MSLPLYISSYASHVLKFAFLSSLEATVKVTREQNEETKKLLRLMGVPVVEAPSEAEATCAALCRDGKVFAAATEVPTKP